MGLFVVPGRADIVEQFGDLEFGRRFGFLYQLVDDWQDGDAPVQNFHFAGQIERQRILAKESLNNVPDSSYRTALLGFVDELAAVAL